MDITHDNVCSSMLSCFYSHLLSTGRPISSLMMFLSQNWYFSVQKALIYYTFNKSHHNSFIKRPVRDACVCMGDPQAPLAPHFVFLITL